MIINFQIIPAIQAFINADMLPASMALAAVRTMKFLLLGANAVSVAISIPIVPKFENPQRAYVAIVSDLSLNCLK